MAEHEIFFDVGQRIAALRGKLTQAGFAQRVGASRSSVEGWEAGKRLPDGSSLLRMHEAFGADITYLLTGKTGGAAPRLRPDQEELLANYDKANSDGRERIRQISATAANAPKRSAKPAPQTSTLIEGEANEIASNHHHVKVKGSNNKVMTMSRK
ncbi:helix-turn-helix domain-containing protein [Rhodoferax aquaticus]|uniref:XRE family transcriptional regulator n=1 Tax=Rhodoferax aquaticus TaxID=2527691 RepID=A0A515ERN9_9BURK|nr:helix-turn-helix transcriptional regulator [Rhodoferax aquaticus]QDL55325.1 XRE family transcriptional regulator [Rhodoferax aquaticus]